MGSTVGRRPFRLKPEPTAFPLHLGVDNHREEFLSGNEQAAKTIAPEPGRYLPEVSYRVEQSLEPSSKQRHTSRQFGDEQDYHHYSAKEDRRAWEGDLTAGLEKHRPAKTPRVIGSFSRVGTGGRSGGRGGDDRPFYLKYRKHQHHHQLQGQEQRRHPGTAAAHYWQSGRNGDMPASPISMVVPSNDYGPVVVGPGGVVQTYYAL